MNIIYSLTDLTAGQDQHPILIKPGVLVMSSSKQRNKQEESPKIKAPIKATQNGDTCLPDLEKVDFAFSWGKKGETLREKI